MEIYSLAELIDRANADGTSLGLAALNLQCEKDGTAREAAFEHMRDTLRVMFASVEAGLDPNTRSVSGMTGGQAAKLIAAKDRLPGGAYIASAEAYALAAAEYNAAMGRIVAAPTAGSCGILPAALLAAKERYSADEDTLIEALFCAAGVGAVIARRATVSGAEGGCQAECGAAAAMAGAALSQIAGAAPEDCAKAVGFALMNLMGLVCDPVGGLVEIPCVYRNVIGVATAITSADLAVAGARLPLVPDDIIDAMRRVGRSLPRELRETGLGGCAACKVVMD
jgi:L-serine dehydratase